jgi:hypothetical protein
MTTYRTIQSYVREQNGFVPKTCWIADVLAAHGQTRGPASNRIDPSQQVAPCPPDKRHTIEQACRVLGRLPG